MKYFSFIFILICTANFVSAQTWHVIDPATIPGDPFFTDVFFTSNDTGWIATGTTNQIYRTDDGAATFSTQTTPFGATNAVHMLDANNGYSGGQGGWVYNTSDGGLDWDFVGTMGSTLLDISFPPGTDPANPIGYACGDNGQVWEITSTLTNLNTGLAGTYRGISAPSVNNVWFCGGNHLFYYNGTTFTEQLTPSGTFNDIHLINNQEGWVVGNVGIIAHTTNGGASWVGQTNPDTQDRSLYGVFFLDSNEGWAVGSQGVILYTANGGTTWTIVGDGVTTNNLARVHFTSSTNGYTVGAHKTLLKYGFTGVQEEVITTPQPYFLSQNSPNPFKQMTDIRWQMSDDSKITLKIYDASGRLVRQFDHTTMRLSDHVSWDGTDHANRKLPSGVYFYRLQTKNFDAIKRMILIK